MIGRIDGYIDYFQKPVSVVTGSLSVSAFP